MKGKFHPAAVWLAALVTAAFLAVIAAWAVTIRLSAGIDSHRIAPDEEARLVAEREKRIEAERKAAQ